MDLKKIAANLINEGFEKGEKLIEMGEFDPMYPEGPEQEPASELSPIVSLDCMLLKDLLNWARTADDAAIDQACEKVKQLAANGPLTSEHLMDITGAADYNEPSAQPNPEQMGGVAAVAPAGPMSPVMASYKRRAKQLSEGVIREDAGSLEYIANDVAEFADEKYGNKIGIGDMDGFLKAHKSAFKRLKKSGDIEDGYDFSDVLPFIIFDTDVGAYDLIEDDIVDYLKTKGFDAEAKYRELGGNLPEEDFEDDEMDLGGDEDWDDEEFSVEENAPLPGAGTDDKLNKGSTGVLEAEDSLEDELADVDHVANDLDGAISQAEEATEEAGEDEVDDLDVEGVLDSDGDGETVVDQLSSLKDRIANLETELGVEPVEDFDTDEDLEDEVEDVEDVEDDLEGAVDDVEDELEDEEDEELPEDPADLEELPEESEEEFNFRNEYDLYDGDYFPSTQKAVDNLVKMWKNKESWKSMLKYAEYTGVGDNDIEALADEPEFVDEFQDHIYDMDTGIDSGNFVDENDPDSDK